MPFVTNENLNYTKVLTIPGEGGKEQRVATLHGTVDPGKSFNFSVILLNKELAAENGKELSDYISEFVSFIRQKATETGIPA